MVRRKNNSHLKNFMTLVSVMTLTAIVAVAFMPGQAGAGMKSPPPEKQNIIIVGDRVVDIAYNLGVVPVAMSVRGGLWPMAKKLKTASQILGCPRCVTLKKEIVPAACKKFGVKRVIVEKSDPYCLYKPKVSPMNVVPLMEGMNVTIEYVDFSDGLEQAIYQTAKLIDREARASDLINCYEKNMKAAKAQLPSREKTLKTIIFNGTYQASTGKTMLRVEAPGGYADRFLLKDLGCVNVGDAFKPGEGKADKGHYAVRKKKGGMILDPLIAANPDIIVMTGDAFAVQRAVARFAAENPKAKTIPAIRSMALYSLPAYVDSGVIEYPEVLRKWAVAVQ